MRLMRELVLATPAVGVFYMVSGASLLLALILSFAVYMLTFALYLTFFPGRTRRFANTSDTSEDTPIFEHPEPSSTLDPVNDWVLFDEVVGDD